MRLPEHLVCCCCCGNLQLSMEKEEEERLELRKMLLGTSCDKEKDRRKGVDKDISLNLVCADMSLLCLFQCCA